MHVLMCRARYTYTKLNRTDHTAGECVASICLAILGSSLLDRAVRNHASLTSDELAIEDSRV
jgi:hypothetical protein